MKYAFFFALCLQNFSSFALEAKKINGITVSILKGDITTCEYEHENKYDFFHADAIVNAANKQLAHGGGVCGAIFSRAEGNEKQLQEYLQKEYPNGITTGQVIASPSFNLKNFDIQYIFHAVGPIYSNHSSTTAAQLLHDAYTNSLELTQKYGTIHSIAFPFISSGIYGYPKKEAAQIALQAVVDYAHKNPKSNLTNVYFVLNNKSDYDLFINSLNEL